MLFDVDNKGEERLYSVVRSLPPNARVTLNGTGVSITALPGAVRTFRVQSPAAQAQGQKVPMRSLRSAKEAVDLLMSIHRAVADAHTQNGED